MRVEFVGGPHDGETTRMELPEILVPGSAGLPSVADDPATPYAPPPAIMGRYVLARNVATHETVYLWRPA